MVAAAALCMYVQTTAFPERLGMIVQNREDEILGQIPNPPFAFLTG